MQSFIRIYNTIVIESNLRLVEASKSVGIKAFPSSWEEPPHASDIFVVQTIHIEFIHGAVQFSGQQSFAGMNIKSLSNAFSHIANTGSCAFQSMNWASQLVAAGVCRDSSKIDNSVPFASGCSRSESFLVFRRLGMRFVSTKRQNIATRRQAGRND